MVQLVSRTVLILKILPFFVLEVSVDQVKVTTLFSRALLVKAWLKCVIKVIYYKMGP